MKLKITNSNGLTRIDFEIDDLKDYLILQDGEFCDIESKNKLQVSKKTGKITL